MSASILFTKDLLEKQLLHCAMCKNLLLSPPIILVQDKGNFCSLCYNKYYKDSLTINYVENKTLEKLITMLQYPCSYEENGCNTKSTNTDLLAHEQKCCYRDSKCPLPLISACPWNGPSTELIQHFLICHKNDVIKVEDNSFEMDTAYDNTEIAKLLILKDDNLLFKLKVNVESNELLYILCNIKDESKNYEYSVKHKGNSENYLKRSSSILSSSFVNKNLDKCNSQIVDLLALKKTCEITDKITNIFKIKIADITPTSCYKITPDKIHIFECPVCRTYMESPILMCQMGHSICKNCKKQLSICPTCRKPYLADTRNYSLEKLIEVSTFPCPYYDSGCAFSSLGLEMAAHEIKCQYRQFRCPVPQCKTTKCSNELITHLLEVHSDTVVSNTNLLEDIQLDLQCQNISSEYLLLAFDQIFRLCILKSSEGELKEHFTFLCEAVLTNRPLSNIFYKIAITDPRCSQKCLVASDSIGAGISKEVVMKNLTSTSNGVIQFSVTALSKYADDDFVSCTFKIKEI